MKVGKKIVEEETNGVLKAVVKVEKDTLPSAAIRRAEEVLWD